MSRRLKSLERRLERIEKKKSDYGRKFVLNEGETYDPKIHSRYVAVLPRVCNTIEEWLEKYAPKETQVD